MLEGRTILVVEREFLIAIDIQRVLEASGAATTVFARSFAEARSLGTGWSGFGLAVIDVAPSDPDAIALAQDLAALGIPLVLTSSQVHLSRGMTQVPDAPVLIKPFTDAELIAACRAAVAGPDQRASSDAA